jgi:hypothetical protein
MSKLHSLLAVYGAIDEAVIAAKSQELSKKFAELLPGTTDLGNRGWYKQVTETANAVPRKKPSPGNFESLQNALVDLGNVKRVDFNKGALPDEETLTKFDLSKLYQTLKALPALKELCDKTNDPAGAFLTFAPATLEATKTHLESLVPASELEAAKCECTSSIREVNGEFCTVLLTDSTNEKVSVDQLKDVLDPLNWPKCNTFFQAIEPRKKSATGWGRMLEVVGTGADGAFTLHTPLKYWKGELDDGSVYLNYDMDDDAFSDAKSDHLVIVDNGYIAATPLVAGHPEKPGVRLRTSKELLIRGMSPTAAATLACNLGWADAGKQMFFDIAGLDPAARPKGMKKWKLSEPTKVEPVKRDLSKAPPENWSLPTTNRDEMVDGAEKDVNDLIDSGSRAVGELMEYWRDGLTPEEITTVSTTFGVELTRSVQSVFNNAVSTVKPATRGGPSNG